MYQQMGEGRQTVRMDVGRAEDNGKTEIELLLAQPMAVIYRAMVLLASKSGGVKIERVDRYGVRS